MIDNLLNWSLVIGFVIGFALNRAAAVVKAFVEDRRHPLADGRHRSKRKALAIDQRAIGVLLMLGFIGWSVFATQQNMTNQKAAAADAKAFAERTQDCQTALIEAIVKSREVSADNDRLSREERALLAELGRRQAGWIGKLLEPPANIKPLEPTDPIRRQYETDVTRAFFVRVGEINTRIDAIHAEQERNDAERPALPDPHCGD